jgi:hypothetical protein
MLSIAEVWNWLIHVPFLGAVVLAVFVLVFVAWLVIGWHEAGK